jgi:hypothetical protein
LEKFNFIRLRIKMKVFFISLFLILIPLFLIGQDYSILPDRLCSPLSVNWRVNYTGVNNAGTSVQIRYDWDDGTIDLQNAVSTGAGAFQTIAGHTYVLKMAQ